MANGWGHSGPEYRKLWTIVMNARPLVCWLCEQYIDPDIAYPDPRSKALHCVVPVSRGGMLTVWNCVPTHRECNLRQGNMLTHEGPFADRQRWVTDLEP